MALKKSTWHISLILLVLLLQLCGAREPEQQQQQPLVISDHDQGSRLTPKAGDSHTVHSESEYDSDKAVRHAVKILDRIQPPKLSLVRLTKGKGFLGKSLYYGQEIFSLLFLSGPSQSEVISQAQPEAAPPKLNANLAKAVSLLQESAEKDEYPEAIWRLAEMNFHGNHTYPRNYTAALDYYHQLADLNGNASAQHMLGFMYATGIGGAVEKDQARALLYHTFAADAGDVRSQMTVGFRHHIGIGTPRNCEAAVKYYRQAAKKSMDFYKSGPPGGHVLVKNAHRLADELGGPYGEGASVSSSGMNAKMGGPTSDAYADISDVLEYLEFQSRKGDIRASFNLAKLYYDGARGMNRDMKNAKRLFMQIARMYWTPSGKINTDPAQFVEKLAPRAAGHLGRMFLRGEGMEQSYERAIIWFKRGIEYGDVLSQYSMGVMYLYGLGVPKDPIRAASYLGPAADNEMAVAQTDLGVLFLDQGDVHTARRYFELAIGSGHIEAYYYLAEIADKAIGRDRSCGVAVTYYKITAEKAEVTNAAFIEANEAHERGDKEKALVAYMMAAEQGYENAQANVGWLLDQTGPLYSPRQLFTTIAAYIQKLLSLIITSLTPSATTATPTASPDAALSLIYYTRSARQNNLDSLLKAGDLHLAGSGTPSSTPSAEHAAACYSAAADTMRSAQAMWNLGWMHETGVGVEKDYHLAKRYYDLAAETNREAKAPVRISLFVLRWRSWWNGVSGGAVRGIGKDEEVKETKRRGFWEWVGEFIENDARMNEGPVDDWDERALQVEQMERERGGPGGIGGGGLGEGGFPGDEYLLDGDIDDALFEVIGITALVAVLGGLIWLRQQRIRRANAIADAERRAALNGGGGVVYADARGDAQVLGDGQGLQAQQEDEAPGQIFPAPDDPDFAPWAANGVGH